MAAALALSGNTPPRDIAIEDLQQALKQQGAFIGRDQAVLNQPWVAARTIHVDAGAVGLLDFGITPARSRALFDAGYRSASAFLETFDWASYKRRFRREAAGLSGAGSAAAR